MPEVETMNQPEKSSSRLADASRSEMQPMPDLADYLKTYARERPEVAALWCFGVGFVLGWKLKPW